MRFDEVPVGSTGSSRGSGGSTMTDVLICGAGPAGAIAALVLARAGVRVRLLDRARFPREKLCGDTLNPGALAMLSAAGHRRVARRRSACGRHDRHRRRPASGSSAATATVSSGRSLSALGARLRAAGRTLRPQASRSTKASWFASPVHDGTPSGWRAGRRPRRPGRSGSTRRSRLPPTARIRGSRVRWALPATRRARGAGRSVRISSA